MIRLVDNWRHALKWVSVQTTLVSGTAHTVLACAAGGVKLAVPLIGIVPLRWVFIIGIVMSGATFVGRMLTRGPKADG